MLSVTAVDSWLRPYAFANRGAYVEFAALGVDVWAAHPSGGEYVTGTSFAAPLVSGLVAIERSRHGALARARMVEMLRANARDLGETGHDPVFGWGFLDATTPCG